LYINGRFLSQIIKREGITTNFLLNIKVLLRLPTNNQTNFMNLKYILPLCILWICSNAVFAAPGQIDFIRNENQFPKEVLFKADLPGGAVFLTQQGFTYNYFRTQDLEHIHDRMHENKNVENDIVHFHAYQVSFVNANTNATIIEEDKQTYYNNYFIGNDASKWASHVPLFKKVTWHNIYSNIDAVVYSKGTSLKYDFIVSPQADAAQIVLDYKGLTPAINEEGGLVLETSVNTVTEQAPYAYQMVNGKEVKISCHFKRTATGQITFEFPDGYNKTLPLIIDPILVFSTFSGSTATTYGFSATYDLSGNLYAGGECFNVGWPVSIGAYQGSFGGSVDDGINKYSSNGSTRIYATYYGGSSSDYPNNMMVNSNNELVVSGSTSSSNLPTTPGCYDNTYNGQMDIYIARFSMDGSALRAATYLGGTSGDGFNSSALSPNYGDANRGEVLAANGGHIIIANSSTSSNFPVTSNAYQSTNGGNQDAVVCELDSNLTTLIYSTYFGGSQDDAALSLVMNSSNQIVICGGTKSSNLPVTSGAYIPTFQGVTDGFVSILNLSGSLISSTFLGTALYDHAYKVQIDELDNVYVLGQTNSASNFPVSPGAFNVANGNIFIQKLNPTLSASLLSTRMGNATSTLFVPTAFMHDVCGNTYFSGFDASNFSPLSSNAYQTTPGSFWLGALSPDFTTLLYGTFFGPIGTHVDGGTSRFDPSGIIYHSACTADGSFPTTPGVVSPTKLSPNWDIASYKFNMEVGAVLADFNLANNANDTGCADYHVTFDNLSQGATNYWWNFGNGDTSILSEPSYTFTEGPHTITLIASRSTGCHLKDTATMEIFVKPSNKPLLHLRDTFLCDPVSIQLNSNVSNLSTALSFHWEPTNAILTNPNQPSVIADPSLATDFTVYVDNNATGECVDTAMGTVHIALKDYSTMRALPADTTICPGDTIMITAYGGSHFIWSPDEKMENPHLAATHVWPDKEMLYIVTITDDSLCKADRTVNIHMAPPTTAFAGPDQDIKRGESAQMNADAVGTFYWMPAGAIVPANILNPVVTPQVTTTYYLYVTSPVGCPAMDSVTINVTNALLPNAFSPNNDGTNDIFKLTVQDDRVRLKDFSVYNRFGQRVFFTKDINEGWNGYYNNKIADMGVYFYYVNYIIGEKTYNLKGDVTLLR
jgi:gliding motility-associated-like protein